MLGVSQSSAESLTLMIRCTKKKIHKIKFGLETTDQTHTSTHTYSMQTHTLTICGTLRHSFSLLLSHTYTHIELHSLIWADSGNRSSELAGGPEREVEGWIGEGGGQKEGGDQSKDKSGGLTEKKQQRREEKREESFEREEKRKEYFLMVLSSGNTGRRKDLKPLDLMNLDYKECVIVFLLPS